MFAIISGIIILSGIVGCFVKGVKLDTQFTGGAVLSYTASESANTDKIKDAIEKQTNRPVTVQIKKDNMTGKERLSVTLAGNEGMSPDEQKEITKVINSTGDKVNAELSETYVVEPYIGAKALRNARNCHCTFFYLHRYLRLDKIFRNVRSVCRYYCPDSIDPRCICSVFCICTVWYSFK